MNPIDQWWNRNFPPYSIRRLLFLLGAAPVMSVLVGLTRGELTRATFLLTTVSGWVVLTIGWYLAREGYAPGRPDAAGLSIPRIEPPTTSGEPMPLPPPPPPPWDDKEVEATLRASAPRRRRAYRTTPLDVLVSGVMLFVAISISTYLMSPDNGFTLLSVGLNLVATALILLVVATSFSLFALLLVAAVAAAPFALLLMLFFLFLGGGGFWDYYWFTAAIAMCVAVGFWFRIRELKMSGRWVKLPLWATSLGASILLVFAAVTATGADFSDEPAAARARAPAPMYTYSYTPPPPGAIVGTPHREGAAQRLFLAWKNGDRAAARTIAHERVVGTLFEIPVDPAAYFRGCGFVEGGWIRCVIQTPQSALLLWPELNSQRSFYIDAIETAPTDHPIDFARYAQMISAGASRP